MSSNRSTDTAEMPLVSILIITYNQAAYIREAVQSALMQDYPYIEIIIADDASTDNSREIICELVERYPGRITPLLGEINLGITGNCNRALTASNGTYIAFLGGDDIYLAGKIVKQVEYLECDAARVLCYHNVECFDSKSNKILYYWFDKYKPRSGDSRVFIKHLAFLCGSSVMIRNPHLVELKFNTDIPVASELLFWYEVTKSMSGIVGHIDGIYVRYRRHESNVTRSTKHFTFEMLETVRRMRKSGGVGFECAQAESLIYFISSVQQFKQLRVSMGLWYLCKMMSVSNFLPISSMLLLCKKLLKLRL